jgi:hypothetical protein
MRDVANDTRVGELREEPSLAAKTFHCVVAELLEDLQSDGVSGRAIAREEDRTHSASPDWALNPEALRHEFADSHE